MPGIGVILNPFSKRYKKYPHKLDHMAFIIGDRASCKPTDDIDDVSRVADEFKTRDIDILAISGGDGTIHCTLSAFIRVYGEKPLPKIYLLRGGTMNLMAQTLGVKGTTEHLMSDLLLRFHNNRHFEEKKLRLTRINKDYYGVLFGIGLIYRFMEEYYKYKDQNPVTAVRSAGRVIGSAMIQGKTVKRLFKHFDATVTVNGERWPFANYNALFSGSMRQIGLNCNVFHHMLDRNDCFHAIGFSNRPYDVLPLLPKMVRGKPSGHPGILEAPATSMKIECEEPMPFMIDGDMMPESCQTFELELGPEVTVVV